MLLVYKSSSLGSNVYAFLGNAIGDNRLNSSSTRCRSVVNVEGDSLFHSCSLLESADASKGGRGYGSALELKLLVSRLPPVAETDNDFCSCTVEADKIDSKS